METKYDIKKVATNVSQLFPQAKGACPRLTGIGNPSETMKDSGQAGMTEEDGGTGLTEEQFYARYDWCLNPVLSLSELFRRMLEEIDSYGSLQLAWQREESRINLYLFASAIACTTDDYLARPPKNLMRFVGDRGMPVKAVGHASQRLIDFEHRLKCAVFDRRATAWREKWDILLDRICDILARRIEIEDLQLYELRMMLRKLLREKLPGRLLYKRMILPEGFRCQDLTHQDLILLAQRMLAIHENKSRLLIIGMRTFGSYFAPLVRSHLAAAGWPSPSYMTIRPKMGVAPNEKLKLLRFLSESEHIMIVDDFPNTGETLEKMIGMLAEFGVERERIFTVAPCHAVHTLNMDSAETENVAKLCTFTIRPGEFHKEKMLLPESVESLLSEYFENEGWNNIEVLESPEMGEINDGLKRHYADGFQVRMKRVFDVKLSNDERQCTKRIFVKSVGWGWLGYHAYLSGTRLYEFAPKVIGLRNGLLFTEWIESASKVQEKTVSEGFLHRMSSYVVTRSERLHLSEDPWIEDPGYRFTGRDFFLRMLRSAYARGVNYIVMPILKARLKKYTTPAPTMIDGHMGPDEWIHAADRYYKIDFEHHNFGGAELDIVDPAYDLASAIFDFNLPRQAEAELIGSYVRQTGDRKVPERIQIYKLIYGMIAMQHAAYWTLRATSEQKKKEFNRRHLSARNALIYQMNQISADIFEEWHEETPSSRIFFLDLDGVFDNERFGFPQTTYSGISALRLLQMHDFSIILNTGRSVENVWNYCLSYKLRAGVAEFGSVLVDNETKREMPLIDAETSVELSICREALKQIPGVFIDESYKYSIRAYRYTSLRTSELDGAEVQRVLRQIHSEKLTFISREEDTYIVQKGLDKGTGTSAALRILGLRNSQVYAMGDSMQDLDMLKMADFAYAPANCDEHIRALAAEEKGKIMNEPFQLGLSSAVRDIIRNLPSGHKSSIPLRVKEPGNLMVFLLKVIELPRFRQLLATIIWTLHYR